MTEMHGFKPVMVFVICTYFAEAAKKLNKSQLLQKNLSVSKSRTIKESLLCRPD